jgi:hypothetical protein
VADLIVAVIFYFIVTDPGDTESQLKTTNTATCAMTAAAVPLFAAAVSEGRAKTAVTGIGGVLTTTACMATLENLQSKPDTPVNLQVQAPTTTVTRSVTLPDLTTPPVRPTAPIVRVSVMIDCAVSYGSGNESFLLRLCYEGVIPPKP